MASSSSEERPEHETTSFVSVHIFLVILQTNGSLPTFFSRCIHFRMIDPMNSLECRRNVKQCNTYQNGLKFVACLVGGWTVFSGQRNFLCEIQDFGVIFTRSFAMFLWQFFALTESWGGCMQSCTCCRCGSTDRQTKSLHHNAARPLRRLSGKKRN